MSGVRRLGVLGGTFDPIHFGHLDAADAAWSALALDELRFIPSHDPPHRSLDPRASAFHRFALVSLAIEGRRGYRACDIELARQGPSYTADTFRALRAEGWAPFQIFFIIGADAFAEIATWREFPEVLDAANFAVIARPGMTLDMAFNRTPELRPRVRERPQEVADNSKTGIHVVTARTRDVSSTMVRSRLADRQSIGDLVPPSVAHHVFEHQLYGAVGSLHDDT